MDTKDIVRRLTDKQKERLRDAKTEEDLKALALEDEELEKAAGGWHVEDDGCFRPWIRDKGDNNCYHCGAPIGPNDKKCPNCGATWGDPSYISLDEIPGDLPSGDPNDRIL